MSKQQHVNNYRTALSADITDTDTTIPLDDVSRVPGDVSADEPLLLTLVPAGATLPSLADVEIIEVTAVDTTNGNVTATRGQDGTTAKAFSAGDTGSARATARSLNRKLDGPSWDEAKAANANVDPEGFWLTGETPQSGGPTTRNAVAIGPYSEANGPSSLSINGAYTSGFGAIATGTSAEAKGNSSAAIGGQTIASGENSLATGYRSEATGEHAAAIGTFEGQATGFNAIVIGGSNDVASADRAVVIGGTDSKATGEGAVAIGDDCFAEENHSKAIGKNCKTSGGWSAVALGYRGVATGNYQIAVGGGWSGYVYGPAEATQLTLEARGLNSSDATATQPSNYQDGFSPGADVGSLMAISGQVAAAEGANGDKAAWNFNAMVYSDGSVAQIQGLTKTQIAYTGTANNWDFTLVDDGSGNAYFNPEVTGEDGKDIVWSMSIQSAQVLFAPGVT